MMLDLQYDLDKFTEWCNKNNISLNISKCVSISFNYSRYTINSQYFFMWVTPFESVSSIRDLGFILSSDLSFKSHIFFFSGCL